MDVPGTGDGKERAMTRGLGWRVGLVVVALLLGALFVLPSTPAGRHLPAGLEPYLPRINLGLDLQGGMHLVLNVQVEQAVETKADKDLLDIRKHLGALPGVVSVEKHPDLPVSVLVHLDETAGPGIRKSVADVLKEELPGWEMQRKKDGSRIEISLSEQQQQRIAKDAVAQALENIRMRVDESGLREPSIQLQGDRRIVVQLPGVKDPAEMRKLIGKTGKLTFHLARFAADTWEAVQELDGKLGGRLIELVDPMMSEDGMIGVYFRAEDLEAVRELVSGREASLTVPRRWRLAPGKVQEDPERGAIRRLHLIKENAEIAGDQLQGARMGFAQGQRVVFIRWDRTGARKFEKITGDHVSEPLAILLDGVVQSAPVIQSKISRREEAYIQGNFSIEEVDRLRIMLVSGALPAEMKFEFEETVGPLLGEDSVNKGVSAAILGLVLVAAFMVAYYLGAGLIANVALAMNVVIILAALAALRATLTVPGIAGIILTMGMAVDANVLIFERIREEVRSGKSIRAAIAAGYAKAFVTIVDANVTTLIAALILMWVGTGPVKGFGVTLSLGLVASMFTSLVVTRVIFDLLSLRRSFRRIAMLELIKQPRFPFVSWRRRAFVLSTVVIIAGLVAVASRGSDNLGIDFKGGMLIRRGFTEPVAIERVRATLSGIGLDDGLVQSYDAGKGVLLRVHGREDLEGVTATVDAALREEFGGVLRDPGGYGETAFVGSWVGERMRTKAILAICLALVCQVVYISIRFQFRFAVAAIIALVHDVVVTTGLFALTGREITLPVVAALLTIVGYSLNDTIVIFDRIRENMRLMRKEHYPRIIDLSLNQTLSRTSLTSLTTLVVLVCLFVAGGNVIHDFAFALIAGVVVGTYSSLFVASPVLVEWYLRGERRAAARSAP